MTWSDPTAAQQNAKFSMAGSTDRYLVYGHIPVRRRHPRGARRGSAVQTVEECPHAASGAGGVSGGLGDRRLYEFPVRVWAWNAMSRVLIGALRRAAGWSSWVWGSGQERRNARDAPCAALIGPGPEPGRRHPRGFAQMAGAVPKVHSSAD